MYVHTYIHTCIYTYILYACIHTYIHTYVHTYILYTYIHTYIHTYYMHANSNLPGRKGGELYVDRGHPSVDPGIKLEGSFMSIQSPSKLIFPWKEASCLLQYVPIAGCVKSGKVVFPGHTWRTITLSTVM